MLTGAQLLSVTQPRDSVTLSYLASMFKILYNIYHLTCLELLPKVLLTLHCFLQRQGRNFANLSQKSALYGVTVKCRDYFQH